MLDLQKMVTETRNEKSRNLDQKTALEIITLMNEEDKKVVEAVHSQLSKIAVVIEWCTNSLDGDGRLIYMGAGTSGRLGVLDAVECPPTFGVNAAKVIGLMAGGEKAFIKAVEGAEDRKELGCEDLKAIGLKKQDVVIALAASGRTPYAIGGIQYAKELGCKTAAIVCNADSELAKEAEVAIELISGPEIVTGSTRLKAGTAQKMVCNMISTASMVGIGKVYENLMVDVVQTNEKLVRRAEDIVMAATECEREMAKTMLEQANGNAKTAIVAILADCSIEDAKDKIQKARGHVRKAL